MAAGSFTRTGRSLRQERAPGLKSVAAAVDGIGCPAVRPQLEVRMSNDAPFPENRRHSRSEVVATAVVFAPGQMHGTYLVQDLSVGGACLMGRLQTEAGQRLNLLMTFPG